MIADADCIMITVTHIVATLNESDAEAHQTVTFGVHFLLDSRHYTQVIRLLK
jgi:hypothetical protein